MVDRQSYILLCWRIFKLVCPVHPCIFLFQHTRPKTFLPCSSLGREKPRRLLFILSLQHDGKKSVSKSDFGQRGVFKNVPGSRENVPITTAQDLAI